MEEAKKMAEAAAAESDVERTIGEEEGIPLEWQRSGNEGGDRK